MENRSGGIVLSDSNSFKSWSFCTNVVEVYREAVGNRTNLLEISSKLSRPIPPETRYTDNLQENFFQAALNFYGRQPVGLPESTSVYRGGWYWQGFGDTCVPWSIINGLNTVGMSIDPYCILGLVREAEAWQGRGLSFEEAAGVIKKFNIPCWIERSSFGQINNNYCLPDEWFLSVAQIQPPSRVRNSRSSRETLEANSRLIKGSIDSRKPLLVMVEYPFWTRGMDYLFAMKHGICISGYRIYPDGIMNVQVIDPYLGVLQTSLEHLSSSVCPSETYYLRKTPKQV